MSWRQRFSLADAPLLTFIALLAVAAGGISGVKPAYGIVMAVGLTFAVLVLLNLMIGFAAMVMFAYLEVLSTVGGVSLAKVAGGLLVVAWLGVVSTRGAKVRNFFIQRPGLTYLLIAFVSWNAISVVWSPDRGEALSSVMRYALDAVLLPIAFTTIRTRRDFIRVLAVVVAGASVAAISAVIYPPAEESAIAGRAAGTVGDPNELAAALLVGLAVASAFAVNRWIPRQGRLLAAGSVVLCLFGIVISLSRGGLIGLAGAIVIAVVVGGRWRGRVLAFGGAVAIAALGYFELFAALPAKERVLDLGTTGGGTGRLDLWTVGWRMVQAHPFIGVGTGQFPTSAVHYLLRPGVIERGDLILSTPKVAHNTYLNILAELGIVGGAMFLGLLAVSVGCTVMAMRRLQRDGDERLEILVRGLLVGIGGYLITIFFITETYSKLLWIVMALGPVLLAIASAPAEQEAAETGPGLDPAWLGPSRLAAASADGGGGP
ncbi:MAG TPA: O-antigen ligase family protein [Solirubrobacteraceae bacterium]|jgi:O-antigen ligase|nr:O-antigen ligase family protein [Solirubrobacteraceae bacterium]